MKYKLSKKVWQDIGKKAGWMQPETEDMFGSDADEYRDEFSKPTSPSPYKILAEYTSAEILWAIKRLGEESIAGFSGVREDEVREVLTSCEAYELGEIFNILKKHKSQKVNTV